MIIQCVPLETAIAFLFIGMNLLVSIILQYIAHAILKRENVCNTDIAGLNITMWR